MRRLFSGGGGGYGSGAAPPGAPELPEGAQQELAKAFFDEDRKALHSGMRLLFTNQIAEAETAFKAGFLSPGGTIKPPLPSYARDTRASYAFPYALSAMFRGLASLENEQLGDCLTRLQTCKEICDSSPEWIGNKLLKGIVALSLGVVEMSLERYGRGAVHIVQGWWLLRGVEEEVNAFDGKERIEVRSLMQLVVGAIEVAVSSLPPTLLRAAKFVGMKGDMQNAKELMWRCYTEEGLLAPVAALFFGIFLIEVKPSIGVPPTAEEQQTVRNILEWGDKNFEGSCFFLMVDAAMKTQNRDLAGCAAAIDKLEPLVTTYPAFSLLVHWTRGRNSLLQREWDAAGQHYEAAIDVHVKVQRRSWIPCMAFIAGLCYGAGGDTTKRDALWGVVMKYKAMKKKNWRAEDLQAFKFTEIVMQRPPENHDIEILYLLKRMSQLRGTPKDAAKAITMSLHARMTGFSPDDAARAWVLQAEFHRLDGDVENVLRCTDEAVALSERLSPGMGEIAVMPEVWLTRVAACITAGRLAEAAASLEKITASMLKPLSKEDRMDMDFRKNAVRQWLVDTEGGGGQVQFQASEGQDDDFQSAGDEEEEIDTLEDFLDDKK